MLHCEIVSSFSKLQEYVTRNVEVSKEYMHIIVGKRHHNLDEIKTKSEAARIGAPPREGNQLESESDECMYIIM